MKHKAVIIGAGSIGALKDDKKDSPTTENVLTVAHAFYNHPDIELSGIVDLDFDKAKKAKEKWGFLHYADNVCVLPENLNQTIEIVSVSVDTESHYDVLASIPKQFPSVKVVLVEKPFCSNVKEAAEIEMMFNDLGIKIVVNYLRRFDKGLLIVKELIKDNFDIYSTVFYYNRGLERDGCHAIDLIHYFFGDIIKFDEFSQDQTILDLDNDDPTIPVHFVTEKCKSIFMLPVDGREVGLFEMVIQTSKGKFVFKDFGLHCNFYSVVQGNDYGEYPVLNQESILFKTGLLTALGGVADNIVDIIDNGAEPLCTADDALKVKTVIENIRRSMDV